jgi:hypothetical protein
MRTRQMGGGAIELLKLCERVQGARLEETW